MEFFEWLNLLSEHSKKDNNESNCLDGELDNYDLFDIEKKEVEKDYCDHFIFEKKDNENNDNDD